MTRFDHWKTVYSDPKRTAANKSYVRKWEDKIHSFLQFDPALGMKDSAPSGSLRGIPVGVKDNIAVKGFGLTCGSAILENFTSPFTSTAVQRLQQAGAVVAGKTNLDEFGMGSSTENSAFTPTKNPWDVTRVPGGSSGGSAAAVAAGLVAFALGSDTGGSVRQPASFCGALGLKPTYGTVSRYGLVAYASSLEVIGTVAMDITLLKTAYETMRGEDPMDQSSVEYKALDDGIVRCIGIVKNAEGSVDAKILESYDRTVSWCEKAGYAMKPVELPLLEYTVPAYYTIATAEASANLARFTGIRYGLRPDFAETPEEMVRIARDRGFGDEVKLRILLGTYVLRSGFQDQYYIRAQKIRTAIRREFERAFRNVDAILMPVFPTLAFKPGSEGLDAFQQKLADGFTASANLAGIPALSFPTGTAEGAGSDGADLPVGLQFLAPAFGENRLFSVVGRYLDEHPVKRCPGFSDDWS